MVKFTLNLQIFVNLQVFDCDSRQFTSTDGLFGRTLTPATLSRGLFSYLNCNSKSLLECGYSVVISQFLERLQQLLFYFEEQSEFLFFASSLLFVYDAEPTILPSGKSWYRTDIFIIDFGHVFPITNAVDKDFGYLFGLQRLIAEFGKLLNN